jgi:hypothetical protein
VDGSAEAVAQLGQGRVGLLGDEHYEAITVLRGQLAWRPARVGLGGEGTGLAATLEQTPDPGGGNAEEVGELLARATAVVDSLNHPLA